MHRPLKIGKTSSWKLTTALAARLNDYQPPFTFNGKIDKITLDNRPQLSPEDIKKLEEAKKATKAESGPRHNSLPCSPDNVVARNQVTDVRSLVDKTSRIVQRIFRAEHRAKVGLHQSGWTWLLLGRGRCRRRSALAERCLRSQFDVPINRIFMICTY
jgi:hypothetical protein